MLTIRKYGFNNNYRELPNNPRLFQEALNDILRGKNALSCSERRKSRLRPAVYRK